MTLPHRRPARAAEPERGQALLLVLGALLTVLVGAVVLGGVARGIAAHGSRQRAADLAALAGAKAMRGAFPRVFEPPEVAGEPNPAHLERSAYLALGERVAAATARRNREPRIEVAFPGGGLAPVRVRVTVLGSGSAPAAVAEADLTPPGGDPAGAPGAGEYRGPFATRQGKRMRPDVAAAFDRLAAAARSAGVALIIVSAFRSDAEQAQLFAAHPDPKWVAPPGQSLHRLGTELDLGPSSAYGWLASDAPRFHFVQRYSWEPWHWGFSLNAGSASVGYAPRGDGDRGGALPGFVPPRFAAPIALAAQRWSVSAALLAAQLYKESNFNPFARSAAGALGIAQFMPATAAAYGLRDPLDAEQAIDAQAHHMRDLLRAFGSVPLALAAYNAGPARVSACGCIPSIPETQAYVADILGLLAGAGDNTAGSPLTVRLVR